MTKATDLTYRVFKLPTALRQAIQSRRDEQESTNEELVAAAVNDHLADLVENLQALGFGATKGKLATVRLPFSDSTKTLDALRRASNAVQIPINQLLVACLTAAVSKPAKSGRGRPRKRSTKGRGQGKRGTSSRRKKSPDKRKRGGQSS